jgi:hypothetical protein
MKSQNKNNNLLGYILLIIIFIIILLFKQYMNFIGQSIVVFLIIYLVIYIIINHHINALYGTIAIFIVLFIINYLDSYKSVEHFENDIDNKEPFLNLLKIKDQPGEQTGEQTREQTGSKVDSIKKLDELASSAGTADFMDQLGDKLNGGIEFNKDDLKLTKPLNHDFSKNKNEDKDPRAKSQKELYELVDTVKTLQETITNLGPVLTEGRKIMDMFENFKI